MLEKTIACIYSLYYGMITITYIRAFKMSDYKFFYLTITYNSITILNLLSLQNAYE